eukprot:TRINITY_DN13825_c0_g1_i1.p1 TRINITY_DN13825_c0_g1~~TRINITY_DN13825_c0_g1_i1.p1  ORF type:complete len:471 (-),score=98.41 TRINITY_DN13825_c0_g1_i1:56-1468(-)
MPLPTPGDDDFVAVVSFAEGEGSALDEGTSILLQAKQDVQEDVMGFRGAESAMPLREGNTSLDLPSFEPCEMASQGSLKVSQWKEELLMATMEWRLAAPEAHVLEPSMSPRSVRTCCWSGSRCPKDCQDEPALSLQSLPVRHTGTVLRTRASASRPEQFPEDPPSPSQPSSRSPQPAQSKQQFRCGQKGLRGVADACHSGSRADEENFSDKEEEEWERRRQTQGLVARMVTYKDRASLIADFTLREGSTPRHSGVIVDEVGPCGVAESAGIRRGDRLVSVNGSKDVATLTIKQLLEDFEVPVRMVFMGHIGSTSSEVRLLPRSNRQRMGFSSSTDQVLASSLYQEEIVFDETSASLALGVEARCNGAPKEMFALEHREALALVRKSLAQAQGLWQTPAEIIPGPNTLEGHAEVRSDQVAIGPKAGLLDSGIEEMHWSEEEGSQKHEPAYQVLPHELTTESTFTEPMNISL